MRAAQICTVFRYIWESSARAKSFIIPRDVLSERSKHYLQLFWMIKSFLSWIVYRSSWVQRKEDQHQTRGPSIRGLVQPHPCPDDGVDGVFRKFVCIYLIVYSSIGSNGPFPLPKYCALPTASLDLIVCIYCLNDLFI